MLVELPVNNIITASGDYAPEKGYHPGRPISIEATGEFGGATVVTGFVSSDDTPAFVIDVGDDGLSRPKTAPGRWISSRPASGKPAIRVTGATGTTEILIKIVDLLPR